MRDLNECKAEIFRRGEKRIRERRAKITKTIAMCVPVFLLIAVLSVNVIRDIHKGGKMDMNLSFNDSENYEGANKPDGLPGNESIEGDGVAGMQSNGFSFNLTWGCYGVSSYDSETGILVKTNDATNPEEYVTTYYLTEEEKKQICDNVKGQKFLYTCKMIQDILVETEEWKELPEYEFLYD